ncbi:hypothetical protein N9H57_01470 [Flavobacteriaceae bacterium]|nr:hypothetical protein [Flavobacteriaceae bacterium]MDA8947788.1 hypothetical protein [Flavobacteriaceae bacterium]MDB3862772.1 hypothetical protein [Flavobacteriaceae bacterium]
MKKGVILFLIVSLFSCKNKEGRNLIVDKQLMDKISIIVSEYSSFYQKNKPLSNIDIYEVYFHKIQDDCFVSINTNIFYKSTLSGFIMINENLITFNSTDNECEIFIHKSRGRKKEVPTGFSNESEPIDNYNPAWWTFKIEGDSLVFHSQGRFKIDFENRKALAQ